MINVIKFGLYRITKSKAFIGVTIVCLLDLLLPIFMNKALYGNEIIYGTRSLEASFMSNDTLLIVFMLFLAALLSEYYSSGAIKNIIGKRVEKLKYYMSNNNIIISIVAVLAMILYSVILTG